MSKEDKKTVEELREEVSKAGMPTSSKGTKFPKDTLEKMSSALEKNGGKKRSGK